MPQEEQCWMRISENKQGGRKVEEDRCRLEGFLEEVGLVKKSRKDFFFCFSPDYLFVV